MFGLQVLDIALGLIFVYLLLSIICTAVNELIAGWLNLRAKNLSQGIDNLLKDKGVENLEKNFYEHPLIKSLYKQDSKPSYISPRTFALAFLDLIAEAKTEGSLSIEEIRAKINKLPGSSKLRKTLLILLDDAADDVQKFRKNIETWFNDAMDRVSGWYKRKTQRIILVLAVLVTALSNADTLYIAKALSNDPALRQAVVAQAQEFAKRQSAPVSSQSAPVKKAALKSSSTIAETQTLSSSQTSTLSQPQTKSETNPGMGSAESPSDKINKSIDKLQQLGIPLGWKTSPQGWDWVNKVIGLLLTAFAASLGAPFWFDMLQKVAKIRATGVSPEESQKKKAK
jgi:cell fate (sporulation/competence/biofilm development) regulator YmcA (YheA/YmcA/DUF963 family)